MKKGRHRRFEEARDLKRGAVGTLGLENTAEPCPECGAEPGKDHASWCLAMEEDDEPEEEPGSDQGDGRLY